MKRAALLLGLCLASLGRPALAADDPIVVSSKSFTESVVLGEVATLAIRGAGFPAVHRSELGGTRVVFDALQRGEIDVYAEYSGTLLLEIFAGSDVDSLEQAEIELERRGLAMSRPLGFNNTYAIGMREDNAERLAIRAIADLARHPDLRLGFSNEFMNRRDGWPSLQRHYGLPHSRVRGLDHDLAYRALEQGDIDAIDLYTTDAEIAYYGLRVLDDDRGFFEAYYAVFLFRSELNEVAPAAVNALRALEGRIDEARIRRMNASVKLDGEPESRVAAELVSEVLGVVVDFDEQNRFDRLWQRTREHLLLVGVAMGAGILVAVPLGIAAAKLRRSGTLILAAVGVVQTIPALALLVFMIPVLGVYEPPAIAALFLYSLLPIVRNTYTGLHDIPLPIRESAEALGLGPMARLFKVELPLASRSILAGVKTSAVISIGFATLGALIGAGGYGQPIFTGIRLDDFGLILEGALPAAVMALVAQALFEVAERWVVPRGLRLRRAT